MDAACAAASASATWAASRSARSAGSGPRGDQVGERAARDVLHGDVVDPGVGVDLVDGEDVGVVEGGGGLAPPAGSAACAVGVAGPVAAA